MILFGICAILAFLAMPRTTIAADTVGLYAADRYNGIPEMCLMPMDFGYCRAKVKRYYFDVRRMKCSMFYWGGCAGNDNNFKSIEDCNKYCFEAFDYDDNDRNDNQNSIKTENSSTNKDRNSNKNTNSKSVFNINKKNFNFPKKQDPIDDYGN